MRIRKQRGGSKGLKQRKCLKCGMPFLSRSPANRVCPSCHQRKGEKTQSVKMSKKIAEALKKNNVEKDDWHGRLFSDER